MHPPPELARDAQPADTGPATPPATYAAVALIAGAALVAALAGPSPLWLYAPAFALAGGIAYAVDRRIRALERARRRPP